MEGEEPTARISAANEMNLPVLPGVLFHVLPVRQRDAAPSRKRRHLHRARGQSVQPKCVPRRYAKVKNVYSISSIKGIKAVRTLSVNHLRTVCTVPSLFLR